MYEIRVPFPVIEYSIVKIVLQRCAFAHVAVEEKVVAEIARGLVLFVGIEEGDNEADAQKMARKIVALRLFDDENGRLSFSVRDIGGVVLAIPNFTLCGQTRKGTRPNFSDAAPSASAKPFFERFVTLLRQENVAVESGVFGADMKIRVENDGPVTLILQSSD